jgi:spore coat protein SA
MLWLVLEDFEEEEFVDRLLPRRHGKFDILFAGRVVDGKGVHTLVEALPHLARALVGVNVHLTIVGDTQDQAYFTRIRDLIEKYDLSAQIEFCPTVASDALFFLFQDYDAYVFPS